MKHVLYQKRKENMKHVVQFLVLDTLKLTDTHYYSAVTPSTAKNGKQ